MRLKKEYLDVEIYIPFIKQTMTGRFIPEGLHPHMAKKFPEFYEKETETPKKIENKSTNDLHKQDSKSSNIHDL